MRKIFIGLFLTALAIASLILIGNGGFGRQASVNNPALLTQGVSSSANVTPAPQSTPSTVTQATTAESAQVVDDFKSDMANSFKAWQSTDMQEFRKVSQTGLAGALLEQKVTEADQFISAGQGADVTDIKYDSINLTNLTADSATIDCELTYSGVEYNPLTEEKGNKFGPIKLKQEYGLQKTDNHWYIVTEKELNPVTQNP